MLIWKLREGSWSCKLAFLGPGVKHSELFRWELLSISRVAQEMTWPYLDGGKWSWSWQVTDTSKIWSFQPWQPQCFDVLRDLSLCLEEGSWWSCHGTKSGTICSGHRELLTLTFDHLNVAANNFSIRENRTAITLSNYISLATTANQCILSESCKVSFSDSKPL